VVTGDARVDELTSALVDDAVGLDARTLRANHAVVGVAVPRDGLEGRSETVVARVDVLHVCYYTVVGVQSQAESWEILVRISASMVWIVFCEHSRTTSASTISHLIFSIQASCLAMRA